MPSKMMLRIIKMQYKTKEKSQKKQKSVSIEATKKLYEKSAMLVKIPKNIRINKHKINGMYAEELIPTDSDSSKIILYLHGGAYLFCSVNTHRGLASLIALKTHIPVLLIEYRKAPENKYPAALEDTLSAYKWLIENDRYTPDQIIIGGDSAGGGLTIALQLKLKELKIKSPKASFVISPWLDLNCSSESMKTRKEEDPVLDPDILKSWGSHYSGDEDASNPFISPLNGDFTEFSPVFIQVGTSEILFNDSTRLADLLKKNGIPVELDIWDEMVHAFPLFGSFRGIGRQLPECHEAISNISSFIKTMFQDVN
ncbi:MAG: alpha/beta hydrolase [archaeon]|nr:alpha/beta hydrolase [archaeon]